MNGQSSGELGIDQYEIHKFAWWIVAVKVPAKFVNTHRTIIVSIVDGSIFSPENFIHPRKKLASVPLFEKSEIDLSSDYQEDMQINLHKGVNLDIYSSKYQKLFMNLIKKHEKSKNQPVPIILPATSLKLAKKTRMSPTPVTTNNTAVNEGFSSIMNYYGRILFRKLQQLYIDPNNVLYLLFQKILRC
ncbi:hypothetical protein BD770DRAFT_428207, partial [Pilaira anomala]